MEDQILPRCEGINRLCDIYKLAFVILHSVAKQPIHNTRERYGMIWAIARKVFVNILGEPVVEGLRCINNNENACYAYRMIFACRYYDGKAYALVEVNPSAIANAIIVCHIIDEISETDIDELIPKKVDMQINIVDDEKSRKVIEEIKSGSDG